MRYKVSKIIIKYAFSLLIVSWGRLHLTKMIPNKFATQAGIIPIRKGAVRFAWVTQRDSPQIHGAFGLPVREISI